jgi:adenosylcobinamide kinase/adenosylcobinamide-phosphate guanylyltransferase
VADDASLTLVLGGARSGKSAFAQQLASDLHVPVLFVATGVATDEEMAARIEVHRASRPPEWRCVEAPTQVGEALRCAAADVRVVLVDCLSFLVSNCLVGAGASVSPAGEPVVWQRIEGEVAAMLQASRSRGVQLIVVSDEVGMGIVPEYPLGRTYRDLLGRANQRLAREAGAVYLMVAGLPVTVKSRMRSE